MQYKIIFWFILILLVEAFALYSIKMASVFPDEKKYIVFAVVSYALIPLFLYKMLLYGQGIGVINCLWNILSTIYGFLIGIYLFQEHVSKQQIVGAILGLIGIILILYETQP